MTGEMFAFYFFGGLMLLAAAGVLMARNPVYAAMNLVFAFFCMAGIYVLLVAHLIAFMQILVYAGAVMVLFLFVIMLLSINEGFGVARPRVMQWLGALGGLGIFALLVAASLCAGAALSQEPPSELLKTADAVVEQVARLRGLAPKSPIQKGVKSRAEIAEYLGRHVRENYGERTANILTIAGLLAIIFYPAAALPLRPALWALLGLAVVNQELVKRLATRRLDALIAAAPVPMHTGTIVLACPPAELHSLPLLCLNVMLRRRGRNVVFLGADVPIRKPSAISYDYLIFQENWKREA